MAVFYLRTAGKAGEAMISARDIAHVVGIITVIHVGVSTPHGGKPFRIRWYSTYDDLGTQQQKTETASEQPRIPGGGLKVQLKMNYGSP